MFCKNCGNKVKDGAKFCDKCGAEQVPSSKLSDEKNNETVGNVISSADSGSDTAAKNKPGILSWIIAIVIMIALIWAAVIGVKWVFSAVGSLFESKDGSGKQASYSLDADVFLKEPVIQINDISFDSSTGDITYEFENISDKDIAYISFETYFYDRMGGALKLSTSSNYSMNLKYTGPLYAGSTDSGYWEYVFDMPSGTAVVYPKEITVTFVDDEEVTFENDTYCYTDDFYGGELKDKQ